MRKTFAFSSETVAGVQVFHRNIHTNLRPVHPWNPLKREGLIDFCPSIPALSSSLRILPFDETPKVEFRGVFAIIFILSRRDRFGLPNPVFVSKLYFRRCLSNNRFKHAAMMMRDGAAPVMQMCRILI